MHSGYLFDRDLPSRKTTGQFNRPPAVLTPQNHSERKDRAALGPAEAFGMQRTQMTIERRFNESRFLARSE
jgi:hypothetical protein